MTGLEEVLLSLLLVPEVAHAKRNVYAYKESRKKTGNATFNFCTYNYTKIIFDISSLKSGS